MSKGTGVHLKAKLAAALAATGLVIAAARFGQAEDAAAPAAPAQAQPAQAQPAAPPASADDMKPFTQSVPGSDVSFDLVPIPGGTFKMGSPESEKDRGEDEGPQVEVAIEPFYMGKHEVTQVEYDLFLQNYARIGALGAAAQQIPADKLADAVTYPTPMWIQEAGPILQRMGQGGGYPAVIMSQSAARQYTKWLSKKTGRFYRLPSEAEWEYACRAGTNTAYHFGDDPGQLGDYAWYYDNAELDGEHAYRKVGQKKPNPWGLYDMHGNVAELVLDAYKKDGYGPLAGKPVKWSDAINWPTKQYPRTARGGGYESDAEDLRAARRHELKGTVNNKDPQIPRSPHWYSEGFWIGLRVISPVNPPPESERNKYWNADDPQTIKIITVNRKERQIHELVPPPDQAAATTAK